jgi:hypothetical protein
MQVGEGDLVYNRTHRRQPSPTSKVLFLNGTKVTDAGLQDLARLKRLNILGLERTRVTDARLAHIEGMTMLKAVHLIDTGVTAQGVARLAKTLPGCALSSKTK